MFTTARRCSLREIPALTSAIARRGMQMNEKARPRKTRGDPLDPVAEVTFFKSVGHSAGGPIQSFRVLDGSGSVLEHVDADSLAIVDQIDEAMARKMYSTMLLTTQYDKVMNDTQRQGRISFYMTCIGEEAVVVGSASAWNPEDEVFHQYREQALLLYRGFTIQEAMSQCFGTHLDHSTKGRQMPVHYGSKKHHVHTVSSPLGTQIPQAAGAAYALKRNASMSDTAPNQIAVCYFGDGAASEGDFHAGLNFASVLGGPIVFLARNNGFAISTPVAEQYAGDGIAARGPAYGIPTIRVDGNDILAVNVACSRARSLALSTQAPVLVECMAYRGGHHSTSDDSSAYRSRDEVERIRTLSNPTLRFRLWLERKGWWEEGWEQQLAAEQKKSVLEALRSAQKELKPEIGSMMDDVFAGELPPQLVEQKKELAALLAKWGQAYEPWREEAKKHEGGLDRIVSSHKSA